MADKLKRLFVLPPLPVRDDELVDFLREVAHIINTGTKGIVGARIGDTDSNIDVCNCSVRLNDESAEMELEFVVFAANCSDTPLWRENLSSIKASSRGSRFWLELESDSQPSIVLYAYDD